MATTTQRTSFAGVSTALGIATESTYGSAVASTVYIPFTDHNLAVSNKLINNQAVRKSIGMPAPGIGSVKVSGDLTTSVDIDTIGPIFAASMGLDTVSGSTGNYTHTFSLVNPLNSHTITADDGQGSIQQFVGCKVNQLDVSCKAGDFLTVKAAIQGQTAVVSEASLSPTYSTRNFFEFAHLNEANGGVSTINGISVDVTDFQISLKNNLKEHYGSTGGRFIVGLNETTREVSGSFTIEYDNSIGNTLNTLLWGASTGPVAGTLSRVPAVFTFSQPASGGLTPSVSFIVGSLTVQDVAMDRKRNDIITQNVKFMASESTTGAADDLKITLNNTAENPYS